MGGFWGYYDDDTDGTFDFALSVTTEILPKKLKDCMKYEKNVKVSCKKMSKKKEQEILENTEDNIGKISPAVMGWISYKKPFKATNCSYWVPTKQSALCNTKGKEYLRNNIKKIGDKIISMIKDPKTIYYNNHMMIAAIALYFAKGWDSSLPCHATNGHFPRKLQSFFPKELRKMAYEASKYQLEHSEDIPKCMDRKKRMAALKEQIELFKPPTKTISPKGRSLKRRSRRKSLKRKSRRKSLRKRSKRKSLRRKSKRKI